mmetsp:Transcript_2253/g.3623  ORF Transcript_2253/g.3623 Transcript_2253/m.3623 type:complete len:490 (+) Transcript_2253:268-1737(+)
MHAVAILEHLLAQERLEYIQRRAIAAIHFDAIEETCEGDGGWDMSRWVQLQKRYCLHVSEQHRLVTHDNYHVALAKAVRDITTRTSVFLSTVDCAHTVPFYLLQQSGRRLDAMIVDEAGAVPEWKMPALTVCAPELIILVGDQQQLPPFTRASRTEAPLSVLQRMEAVLPAGSIKMLRLQYRMPPQICEFLSAQFYNSSVNTADETRLRCSHLSEPAITWLDHNEHESNHGTSFYNTAEIQMIVDLLNSEPALARDKLAAQQKTAVVITFYSAQVARLQARLQSSRPDVFIMTVDAAQGCEADYVVLSCVRCNTKHTIGHVANAHRINVAMSRARERLLVVGSSKTLVRAWGGCGQADNLWYAFKKHMDALLPIEGRMDVGVGEKATEGARQERFAGYKVKLCNTVHAATACPFGAICVFAHGEAELRCRDWTLHATCHRGHSCPYLHELPLNLGAAAKALRVMPSPPLLYQTNVVHRAAMKVTLGAYM